MNIYCDESKSQLIQKDIPNCDYERSEDEDESDEESDDEHKKAA